MSQTEDMSRMDESFARKVLHAEEVARTIYDKDVDAPAYIIGEEGQRILQVNTGGKVIVPTFPYKSSPRVFGPTKATKDRIRQEEELVMRLVFSASDTTAHGRLSGELLMSARKEVEAFDLEAKTLVISPDDMPQFESELSMSFTEDDTYSLVEATGQVLGLDVYAHPRCPQGHAYLLQEALYLGRVCLSQDKPHKCGMAIFNPRPVVHLSFE